MKSIIKMAVAIPLMISQMAHADDFRMNGEIFLQPGEQRVKDRAINEDPNNLSPWIQDNFDVVILINKANSKGKRAPNLYPNGPQTATIYVRDGNRGLQITKTVFISTGREELEFDGKNGKMTTAPYISQTPTGYYTVKRYSIDHKSGDWAHADEKTGEMVGSAMPFAVFFNQGKATHQVPNGSEDNLGHRASGACVRMFKEDAEYFFWSSRYTSGPLTPAEMQSKKFMDGFNKNVDANGVNIPLPSEPGLRVSMADNGSGPILAKGYDLKACSAARNCQYEMVKGTRTLVIVQNVRADGKYTEEFENQFGNHFYTGISNGRPASRNAATFTKQLAPLNPGFQDGVFNGQDNFNYNEPAPKPRKTSINDKHGYYFEYKGKTYFEHNDGEVYFVRKGKATLVEDPRPRQRQRQRFELEEEEYFQEEQPGLFNGFGLF